MNTHQLVEAIIELTVPCFDDGKRFTETKRLDYIEQMLRSSRYDSFGTPPPLARIYKHALFSKNQPTVLISCHVDSIYNTHWCEIRTDELQGTLDNSACNGILLYCMLNDLLPPQVIISFTGNEEFDSIGVDQTVQCLQINGIWDTVEMVVTLDLTEEGIGSGFTVENLFVETVRGPNSVMTFTDRYSLKDYLFGIIGTCTVIEEGDPDESWQYDEYDLNAFSLCLPCRLLADDMHDDQGVAISLETLGQYTAALVKLTVGIIQSLNRQKTSCTAAITHKSEIIMSAANRESFGFRQFLKHLQPIVPDERYEWQDVLKEYDEEFPIDQPTLFWYPSSGFDLRALVHFNEKDTSEVYGTPTVDFFVYSDYNIFFHGDMSRYYKRLDDGPVVLFRDARTLITLEQMIPLALMSDQEASIINAANKFKKDRAIASNIAYYCMIDICSHYFDEEYFPLIYIPIDNWVLMEIFWKPFGVRFQYICAVCDGCGKGGARVGPDHRAMCVNCYYKDFLSVLHQGGYWISDHIHRNLPRGFNRIATFKGWGPYNENNESYLYRVEADS